MTEYRSTMNSSAADRQRGFNFVELLVTLAVLAILVSLAAPAMNYLITKNGLRAESRKLQDSLNYARAEAVARGAVVTLNNRGNGGDWTAGWDIFVDANANGTFQGGGATPDTMLKTLPAPERTLAMASTTGDNWISFNGSGMLNGGAAIVIELCDPDAIVDGITITISLIGRTTSAAKLDCPAP